MNPEDELRRAGEAKQILGSLMFQEACQRVIDGLSSQRRSVPMTEVEMHTKLILAEQLWMNMTDWLKQVAETGQFAEFTLRQREASKRGLFGLIRG